MKPTKSFLTWRDRLGEAIELVHKISREPARLTEEHTTQGLLWFGRHAEKALGIEHEQVLDIVNHFDHFTWDGTVYRFGPYENGEVPVWTVHLDDGRELRYHYAPWVNGVNESGYTWTKELV